MRVPWRALAALAALQAGLAIAYLAIEADRGASAEEDFTWEPLDEPAPALSMRRDDAAVRAPQGPHLVHFWATWCAPCLEELPGLLAATEAEGVPLFAVTDEPWGAVEGWFGGAAPPAVVRDPGAATRWRVSGLPDTFAVTGGRVTARVGGPRDWSSPAARRFLQEIR